MLRTIIAACFVPLAVFAADLEFAGGLERVTQESLLIRLAKGERIAAKPSENGRPVLGKN
jgi:hypothetical protein